MSANLEQLVNCYLDAKNYVIQSGYDWEIDWQAKRSFKTLTETEFLREAAWVIISCGFRETIVRRVFPKISQAFLQWRSAKDMLYVLSDCRQKALGVFGNNGKINAICDIISRVATEGFQKIKDLIQKQGLAYVQQFPYMGPVTGLHLLKNIGIPTSKPDRHLVRIADATGYETVQDLCESIKKETGDGVSEVDIVLWRYATLRPDYISHFKESGL